MTTISTRSPSPVKRPPGQPAPVTKANDYLDLTPFGTRARERQLAEREADWQEALADAKIEKPKTRPTVRTTRAAKRPPGSTVSAPQTTPGATRPTKSAVASSRADGPRSNAPKKRAQPPARPAEQTLPPTEGTPLQLEPQASQPGERFALVKSIVGVGGGCLGISGVCVVVAGFIFGLEPVIYGGFAASIFGFVCLTPLLSGKKSGGPDKHPVLQKAGDDGVPLDGAGDADIGGIDF
jgi:hypothetical protein